MYFCHKSQGEIIFDPKKGTKHFSPWWALLICDEGILDFYNWLSKKYGKPLKKGSLWGSHVSFIKGEKPEEGMWGKDFGVIDFKYSNQIRSNQYHVWLDVECDQLHDIRKSLGLPQHPRNLDRRMSLHLTLGTI